MAEITLAQTVNHRTLGTGAVLSVDGAYARVFFREGGEQLVPVATLETERSWDDRVVATVRPASEVDLHRLRLALEAHALPLLGHLAELTAAKVDLLPHQVVLTHRVATAPTRRLLVADDVGLGKTIETALILRELASRGELTRALMIVPAGLVENWRRELNDVFHLDFEVFGADGDVTDRASNAFVRHHRLIASIDTLKRPARIARLQAAPDWDLIVVDEAHHLTATRKGSSIRKTQNYRLAEELRRRCRDMLLLSATPHQGDHFRFLALLRLLEPGLFHEERDMLANRHRLNAVMVRRTKTDACRADGSPLFARRQVHSTTFCLSDAEKVFYEALTEYIRDGFNLAAAAGGKQRAIGFVMTVFQKIASSSFAAVRSTLQRRLISLTVREAVVRDEALDVGGRDALLREARAMLMALHGLEDSQLGRAEADRLLADIRLRITRKLAADLAEREVGGEAQADSDSEAAASLVEYALPEERQRIRALLTQFPRAAETKTLVLLDAMGDIWATNPDEKMIVFTTYLNGVEALRAAIEDRFPGRGVEILKGGDQGSKTAAERRFRRPDGPRVMICTAAGREGINLQFARVLFNHDLPWNPMDLEQRIGRIHRYGQVDTAQVYNLVAADTIEGKVFMMLEEKIKDIARALGKLDERGEVAEDLRGQILGQLTERISFNHLYQEALRDPTLQRTDQELEAALTNARQARELVSELFQDLEPFRLDDYQPRDVEAEVRRIRSFVEAAAKAENWQVEHISDSRFAITPSNEARTELTTDRDEAMENEALSLLGIEHPLVVRLVDKWAGLPAGDRGLTASLPEGLCAQTVWEVRLRNPQGRQSAELYLAEMGMDDHPHCRPLGDRFPAWHPALGTSAERERDQLVRSELPRALRSHLAESGKLEESASLSLRLLAWVEA